MDDGEEIENPVDLSDKNWNRVMEAATKAGYSEGVEEGKQSVFQQGFDIGYEDAFRTAFILGKYKGVATSLANGHHNPSPVDDILDKTRRGACYLCAKKLEESRKVSEDPIEPPLQEVRDEQRKHSDKAIEMLRQHFEPMLKNQGMSIDNLTF